MSDISLKTEAADVLDRAPVSPLQVRVFVLCGLVGTLDGNDTSAIGVGAPSLAAALHVAPSAMGWAISGSFWGAAIGALLLGSLCDRFGRKAVLVVAVLLFGVFTCLTPVAATLPQLVACRLVAGLGLRGATPCFITLTSEYAPAHLRASLVSLVWASFPLSILLGGLMNAYLLTRHSWEVMFLVGGILPLAAAAAVLVGMPESCAFLMRRPGGHDRVDRILRKVGAHDGLATITAEPASVPQPASRVRALFEGGFLRLTLCLWLVLFACFGTTASMNWIPTVMHQAGVSAGQAAVASSFLGLGALLGMAMAGRLLDQFGAGRALMVPVVLGAVATAAIGIDASSVVLASVFVTLVGLLVGLGASGGIAMLTLVYAPDVRATAVGWAMSMGRLGQVLIPGAVGVLLARQVTPATLFLLLGACPALAALAFELIHRAGVSKPQQRSPAVDPA